MKPFFINLAVEDDLSDAVLRRIIDKVCPNFQVHVCYGKKGISYLQKNILSYNNAAKAVPYLVLVDLDQMECAPSLIKKWFTQPRHPHLLFRIAVREVEAWLLADRKGIADFFSISQSRIPILIEEVDNPKQTLINLARLSRRITLRDAIVPPHGSTCRQGADYNSVMIGFVQQHWDIGRACANSISLRKTVRCIENFQTSI